MDWLELKIDTSHAGLDAVTDMLEQQGVTGVMIDDEADFQSFLENNRQYWDYVDDDLLVRSGSTPARCPAGDPSFGVSTAQPIVPVGMTLPA